MQNRVASNKYFQYLWEYHLVIPDAGFTAHEYQESHQDLPEHEGARHGDHLHDEPFKLRYAEMVVIGITKEQQASQSIPPQNAGAAVPHQWLCS